MRLIDADLLKENIIKCLKPLEPEKEMIDSDVALLSTLMEIDKQPTAFDVDKISKELVKQKKIANKKMNKTFRDNLITYGMVIAAYVIMQILVSAGVVSSLLQGLLVPLCTYAILAVSLNLTVGILGQLSLGHAGFMCIGAFTSAFFSKVMENTAMPSGLRFFIALLIGAVFAGVFGLLIGIPVLRLKGDYLAIVTLAFGEIIKNLVNILFV